MDVDKLFKLPKVPQSSLNKRKWVEPTKPSLKSLQDDGEREEEDEAERSRHSVESRRVSKAARVSVGDDEEREEVDGSFAPGNDADYFVDEDDDGGRFFGGGLTSQQKRILEIMNDGSAEDQEGEDSGLKAEDQLRNFRKSLVKLERAINKNQEMRVRFSDDPSKYIESEADLDAAIKALVISTTNPPLFYPEMIKQGSTSSLCSLLSHDNLDISASVIELLEEMTDDDVLDAGIEGRDQEEQEEASSRKGEECVNTLLDSLLEQSVIDLLVQNLSRFREKGEEGKVIGDGVSLLLASDMGAVYHLLGLFENIASLRSSLAASLLLNKTMLDWLLARIAYKGSMDQNKAYAAELIGVFMQSISSLEDDIRKGCILAFRDQGGIARLLELLAQYRNHDPSHDDDEVEYMENLFDILCASLTLPECKQTLYKEEGTELMCILLKSKGIAHLRAIKTLNHALSTPYGSDNCVQFVQSQGLKPFFSVYMGKHKSSSKMNPTMQDEEYMLEIITSLLNNLKSESIERIRLISKFVEKEYEKVDRLMEMRSNVRSRLDSIERDIERRKSNDEEELLSNYLDRMEHGLYSLQLIDYTLVWLVMEDDGILSHVKMLFSRGNASMDDVIDTLKEYYENVGDDTLVALPEKSTQMNGSSRPVKALEVEEASVEDQGLRLKEVIVNLVNYLLSL